MTYWWWTSWTAYQVRGSVSTGEVSLRKRRQWWTAFQWWHSVPSPVQLLSSTSSGLREPGHTCGTLTQVHEHTLMAAFACRKRSSAIWRKVFFVSKWLLFFEVICIDIYTNVAFVTYRTHFLAIATTKIWQAVVVTIPLIVSSRKKGNMAVTLNRKVYKSSLSSVVKRTILSSIIQCFYWFQRENVMKTVTEKLIL